MPQSRSIPQRYSDAIILISSNSLRIFGHQVDEKNPLDSGDVAEADENGDDNMAKVKPYYYQKPTKKHKRLKRCHLKLLISHSIGCRCCSKWRKQPKSFWWIRQAKILDIYVFSTWQDIELE